VLVEPFFLLNTQVMIWTALYVLLACGFLLCLPARRQTDGPMHIKGEVRVASPRALWTWFVLSASGSAVLISITNILTFDVASVPFLWILPLAVYLFTFVLVFRDKAWIPKWLDG